MSVAKQNLNQGSAAARDLKQKVLTCLHNLSDRDTYAPAAAELESISKALSPVTLPPFLTSITAIDSAYKSAVRKQCLNLISLLAVHHGNALSPYVSKLLAAVLRRLRDPDSSIRAACASAAAAIASHVTKPSFSTLARPFLEALFTEQEANAQIGAAACLSAVIRSAVEPDLTLLKRLMGRFEKLVKCDAFKAKAAVLGLIGSVIEVGGAAPVAAGSGAARNLITCLVGFLSSDDWAARKAAAEGLMKLALFEKDSLRDVKSTSLKIFEAKRYDKVKAVRETMNQMLEVWKEIPDESDEGTAANLESHSSAKENGSDGRYTSVSRSLNPIASSALQARKKFLSNRSSLCNGSLTSSASKRSLRHGSEKITGAAMFQKLESKKTSDFKVEISIPNGSEKDISEGNDTDKAETHVEKGEERNRLSNSQAKRALFIKPGCRVVPCNDVISESTMVVSNETRDPTRNPKESEDLLLIRKQLVQIENQQSNLLDLLQKFIGSSQSGMQSLETRVHGLELALDELSFDLAVSTGRMSSGASAGSLCCKLPGAAFWASKLWRRTESLHATKRFTSSTGTATENSMRIMANESGNPESFKLHRRSRYQGGRGIIMNPLAKIHGESQGTSAASSNRILENVHIVI